MSVAEPESVELLALSRETSLRELAEGLLDRVRSRVVYADLVIEEITKLEYTRLFTGDDILKPFSRKSAVQLRLVGEEGRHLAVSLGVLPVEELAPALDTAIAMLALQEADPTWGLAPIPHRERVRYGIPAGAALAAEELVTTFDALYREVAALAAASVSHEYTIQTELWCYSQIEEKLVADTQGLFKTQILPSTFLQVIAQVRDTATGKLTRQRVRLGDTQPLSYLFAADGRSLRPQCAAVLQGCVDRAIAQQRGRRLTPEELAQVTHYVLAPTAMVFVHEAEGHNFEADIVKEGGSGLFTRDGKARDVPFASADVEVWDGQIRNPDGSFDELAGFGTHFIDDEGVELQPVRLVDGGEIVAMLHNRETAFHYGVPSNGHGFSELGDSRLVRMTNTYLYPAKNDRWHATIDALIADIPFGVWLEGSLGGAVTGEGMSTTIQYGRLIRDGRWTDDVLLPANLSVVTRDSLKLVDGFAGPLLCEDPGFCGKGQTKTVTDGGPVTRIQASPAITLGF